MRIALSRISKREICIDDTADLACGHGLSKNNGEGGEFDLRVRKNFEIVLWEERGGGSARVSFRFVVREHAGVYLKGRKRGWRQRRTTSCHPEKTLETVPSFASGLCGRDPTISSSTKSRVVYREIAHPRPIGMHASCNSKE